MDTKILSCLMKFPTNSSSIDSSIRLSQAWTSSPLNHHSKLQAICKKSCKFYYSNTNYKPGKNIIATKLNPVRLYLIEEFRSNPLNTRKRRGNQVKASPRFNSSNGGGGNNEIGRVVFNLALAGGLTYLTVTGKLGWVFDAIVSLWLFSVLVPMVGVVAFLWFAGRDMIQGTCPNCGNEFQIFESALKDGPQLCPYCSQPFKLQDKEFVRDSPRFSTDRSGTFKQSFDNFSRGSKNQEPSVTVVDIEAEVKDKD